MTKARSRGLFTPNSYAKSYLLVDGVVSLRFKDDWCYVYKGRERVWDCNATFAKKHFSRINP